MITAPVVSRSVSPTTTEGAAKESNCIESTDVELPLTSPQANAAIETNANENTAATCPFLIPDDQPASSRDSRRPVKRHRPERAPRRAGRPRMRPLWQRFGE